MATTINNKVDFDYQLNTPYANIDANYGPWSSIDDIGDSGSYMKWRRSKVIGNAEPIVLPGTLIAIHDLTTDEVTLKIYSKGKWVDVCSGNHDDEESDDPSPTPPDPQPPETVTLVSIAVSNQTTSYQVGDTFNFDGTCTATYSDDSQQTVIPTNVSTPSMSTSGSKTITVSYTENGITKTTTYTISVAAPVVKTASFIAILRTVKNATTGKDTEVTYDSVEKGTVITYKVTIQNNGNVNLTGGKVTSTLPDVQDITFAFNPGGGSNYTYTHTVTQADVDRGFIYNQITASAQSAESGVANPTDVIKEMKIITEAASPSLTITKSADTSAAFTITTGTNIPYTITVKNTGNVTLASGTVADSKFVILNNTFTSLAPGSSKSFTYTYTVTQNDVNAGKIENKATVSNVIAARGINPSSDYATKTIIVPGPVTPIEPIEPIEPEPVMNLKFVDLGLTSGTLWATTNIGAEDPADVGDYFAYGEIVPKSTYSWSNYKYCNGTKNTLTKYCLDPNYWGGTGEIDNKNILDTEDDAAKQIHGNNWCVPTGGQLAELNECRQSYTSIQYNGKTIYGITFYGRMGNLSIFLPITGIKKNNEIIAGLDSTKFLNNDGVCRGFYLSKNVNSSGSTVSYRSSSLTIYKASNGQSIADIVMTHDRCYGMAIRPVYAGSLVVTNVRYYNNSEITSNVGEEPDLTTGPVIQLSVTYKDAYSPITRLSRYRKIYINNSCTIEAPTNWYKTIGTYYIKGIYKLNNKEYYTENYIPWKIQ